MSQFWHMSSGPVSRYPAWLTAWGCTVAVLLLTLSVTVSSCGTPEAHETGTPNGAGRFSTSTPAAHLSAATAEATPTTNYGAKTWIPFRSQSAADVLAAVRQAPFLQLVSSAPPSSDGYTDLSHLDSPELVLAYHVNKSGGSVDASDYYEVPAMTPSGTVANLISAELNSSHTAISVGSVSGSDPTKHWPGRLVPPTQAVQIVQVDRHTGLRAGEHAQLIYLAAYDTLSAYDIPGHLTWNAGGGGPQNPIWLIPGADGHDYFVGTDGKSYTQAQLPLQGSA
ncbi:MAG: hypothetical protein ACXWQR_00575 [Ktedonobacterales bacterium]